MADDWPALIAGNRGDDILPDLVLSGPPPVTPGS